MRHELSSMSMFRLLLGYAQEQSRFKRGLGEILENELQNFLMELQDNLDSNLKQELYDELVEGMWARDAWSLKASLSIVVSRLIGERNQEFVQELTALIDDAHAEMKERGLVKIGELSQEKETAPQAKPKPKKSKNKKKKKDKEEEKLKEEVLEEAREELDGIEGEE